MSSEYDAWMEPKTAKLEVAIDIFDGRGDHCRGTSIADWRESRRLSEALGVGASPEDGVLSFAIYWRWRSFRGLALQGETRFGRG